VIDLLEGLQDVRRFFFTATPRETRALSMFVEPEADDSDECECDEDLVDRSRRLVGGLIFEYGFADAMQDGVITDYSLGFIAYHQTEEPKE
jgi:predicted helicase